jgi:hypothetical protein
MTKEAIVQVQQLKERQDVSDAARIPLKINRPVPTGINSNEILGPA